MKQEFQAEQFRSKQTRTWCAALALSALGVIAACDARGPSTTAGGSAETSAGTSATPGTTPQPPNTAAETQATQSAQSGAMTPGSGTADAGSSAAGGTSSAPTAKELSPIDRSTMAAAASGGQFEVEAAKLAAERAQNPAVRKFAQMMIDDHSKVNKELEGLASSKGIKETPPMNEKHAAQLEKLRSLKGSAFDREYVAQAGVAAHRESIDLYEQVSRESNDPDWRAFADNKLSALRAHQTMTVDLAKQVGVPAGAADQKISPPSSKAGSGGAAK